MIRVTENLGVIRDLLAEAAREAGRDPATVRLLAVSKKKPASLVAAAAGAGQLEFGENIVREGVDKIAAVGRDDLVWHFIGTLQSNKTKDVATHFDWAHSVDRLKIAKRLSDQRPADLPDLNVCIQVNVDAEASKSGVAPAALGDLARAVAALPRLRLRGLMCLPAIRDGLAAQREPFARLRRLKDELADSGLETDTLSMGMSDDFRAAILEGSTIVRIGTAIFGSRD
ncbi:MAG: YggS family pyridoxal phosphate-dependent enzyme [Woeseiaceae bacterium]|nr:YggS family pyridoxal phosphate-dependent enzyme [Woeseiaceae bacterium]